MRLRFIPILGLGLLGGCSYNVAERIDSTIADIARQPFDREPKDPSKLPEPLSNDPAIASRTRNGGSTSTSVPAIVTDIKTAGYLSAPLPNGKADALTAEVPPDIPGAEAPKIQAKTREEIQREAKRLYQPLPPLPAEPAALPKADGTSYTLSELQEIAALNSPTLKQAASDVRAAEGALIQARTYANPTVAYGFQPSNNGETAGVHGILFDQKINTVGKLGLKRAAAQKDYDNSELALKKARSDLATKVRTAYFGLLVAKEAVRVNRALCVLTDEIYLIQVRIVNGQLLAAVHEPAALRAQTFQARLALKNSITNYGLAWKQVVWAIGMRQLPLSAVSGRIDTYIPYYDYDAVFARVVSNHTDILTARNGIEKARYALKLQQVTPISDVDFQFYVGKETSLAPFQWVAQGQVGITLPLWDQNRGNIISAEAAVTRALEQPHAAELNLAYNLQNACQNYKNNLDGLEYYRRYILPDQVRAYRGILRRRQIDPNAQFGDLVQAQQTLATSVTMYLGILGQLWNSAVNVADFLQTDDLFQLANPQALDAIPDLGQLPPLPCCHPGTKALDGTKPRPEQQMTPKPLPNPSPLQRIEVKP